MAALVACVVRAALPFAADGTAIPIVSPQAAALAEGALQMMLWNKIKIVAAMVCMIALVGAGSGWLARGREAPEAYLPVAEPPVKKEGVPAAADPVAKLFKKAIDDIHGKLDDLAKGEDEEESQFLEQERKARLQLLRIQDSLRLEEREMDFDRQQEQEKIKAAALRLANREESVRDFIERIGGYKKKEGVVKEELERLVNQVENQRSELSDLRNTRRTHEHQRNQLILSLRQSVLEAENKLHRLEKRHAGKRAEFAAKRQALLARLQQLEERSVGLEPTDRLRDVERKLDALRREVGELRRTLERQGKDTQK